MIDRMFRFFDETLWGIWMLTKHTPDSLCLIETVLDDSTLALSNDGLISVIDVRGCLRLLDGISISKLTQDLSDQFSSSFSRKGHFLQFVFVRDPERGSLAVREALKPGRISAERMRLDMEDYFESMQETLSKYVSYEAAWIVVGTDRSLLNQAEKKQDGKRPRIPVAGSGSIRLSAGSPFLLSRHHSLVDSISSILKNRDIVSRVMKAEEVIRINRMMADPDFTSENWKPRIPGTRFPLRSPVPGQGKNDWSHLLYPGIGRQVFPRDATVRSLRVVEIGNQIHAPLAITVPPENPMPFLNLFSSLASSRIPWRASFLLTGDGLSGLGMKSVLAAFMTWTASENSLISESIKDLNMRSQTGEAIVGWQAIFDTWAPSSDPDLLSRRASTLAQAVQGWGNCEVSDQTGDPLLGVVSSFPGFASGKVPAPRAAAPIDDALLMAPFFRPALPWDSGAYLLRSPDGKLMPFQPGSSLQAAWVELGSGPMGYGKSANLSTMNLSLVLSPGRDTLPWIMTVDRGPSSSGLVNLIRSRLPDKPEYQRLVAFHRLQNTPEYAINPFDTPLGCRKPLPMHRSFLQNLLTILGTATDGITPDGVPGLMQLAIDRTYEDMSPFSEGGTKPRLYEPGVMPEVDEAIQKHKVELDQKTTWWDLEDAFFEMDLLMEASLAHRKAVPTLSDVAATLNDATVSQIYREGTTKDVKDLVAFAWRSLMEAINQYPILSGTTRFDIGDARIVALDIDEVTQGSGPVADRQKVVMYMMTRHVLGFRLFLMPDHVPLIHPKYQKYHAERIAEIRRDPKKLSFDEFHHVSQNPILVQQFQRDLETAIRESRKWNLHIGLYSQRAEDFPDSIIDQATTIMIFGAGNEQEAERTSARFRLDPVIARALPRITKPNAEGANFVACFRTEKGFVQQLLTNTLSPVALWSFSTVAEDTAVRLALQPVLGVKETIRRLVKKYPGGVKVEAERRQLQKKSEDEGDVLSDIANELLAEL
ncbi:ATP-binding protein [Leptospirillum ferriphilum]|uniref:ATP-binding protein n=1 Tax=Leptospirillum ferriphilum TaxID=178606 RepID=UPI0006B1A201|nr:ATP-binding protein [Leptospirillum ferriphilum]